MAIEITVPRLGWSMDEGTFTEWLKKPGEWVKKGDMLFTLEGDKSLEEIESFDEGFLAFLPAGPGPGDSVTVGQLLGYLLAKGESIPVATDAPSSQNTAAPSNGPVAEKASVSSHLSPNPSSSSATSATAESHATGRIASSPRARRTAAELGIDWQQLEGSGGGGRIRNQDVLAAAERGNNSERGKPSSGPAVALDGLRRTIAARMLASHQQTAPVTLTTTVDASNLVNLRTQCRAADLGSQIVPAYHDFLVKLVGIALGTHPALNRWLADGQLTDPGSVNIGLAVDTDAGLLVPVIKDVPSLAVREIAQRSAELIDRARRRQLKGDELRGATFTVSNLGSYGIEGFTPIIDQPQVAILGVGHIMRRPVVRGEQIVPGDEMVLSLTFDHRAVDGAPAARFLQFLGKLIENPAPVLLV